MLAARLHAHQGRLEPALRSLAAAEKGPSSDRSPSPVPPGRGSIWCEPRFCADGAGQMLADAEKGLAGLGREIRIVAADCCSRTARR